MESMTLSKMLTTKTWCPKCRVSKFAKQNEWLDQCSNSFPLGSQPWPLFWSIEAPFWTLLVGFRSMLTHLWTVLIHCRDINIGQRPLTSSSAVWISTLVPILVNWGSLLEPFRPVFALCWHPFGCFGFIIETLILVSGRWPVWAPL